jgi:hypothetical protein
MSKDVLENEVSSGDQLCEHGVNIQSFGDAIASLITAPDDGDRDSFRNVAY